MDFFSQLAIVIVLCAALAILFRMFRQPPILAYILAGILLAQAVSIFANYFDVESLYAIKSFSDNIIHDLESMTKIGVTLLLFLLGLELKFGELKSVGKVALFTGVGQIVFTVLIGLVMAILLGFGVLEALYVAIGITFSSTIIIVKLLSDKKEINSLHGKISIGFLLVQDFCAISALIILTIFSSGKSPDLLDIVFLISKAALLFSVVIFLSKYIFPFFINKLARSQEILFLTALAWAFGLAAVVSSPAVGFSVEIGGFLAGLALANSLESTQIISKVRPIRDFFIVIFFVALGGGLGFDNISQIILPAIILSLFVLIGNPIVVLILLRIQGFKTRTGLLSGLTVAQISEFSIILALAGARLGHVQESTISLLTIIAIITFTFSTYMINYSHVIHRLLKPILKPLDRGLRERYYNTPSDIEDHIIIIGAHRLGSIIIKSLEEYKKDLLIVDFNPDIIESLRNEGYNVLFGDMIDSEVLEKSRITNAKVVISTVPQYEDNLILLQALKEELKSDDEKPEIILTAHTDLDREDLLKAGGDIVVMPYTVAGESIARRLKKMLKSTNFAAEI